MVWLPVLVPIFGAISIAFVGRHTHRVGPLALVTLSATLAAAVMAAISEAAVTWGWGAGIELSLSIEGAGRVMVVLVPLVAVPVVAFAASSLRDDAGIVRLLALMTAFVGVMELLVSAGDFLTLLIGWELVGAASWALIGHQWRDASRPLAAKEAFIATRFGDIGIYLAAGGAFAATGSFSFSALAQSTSNEWLGVVAGGMVLAAVAKSGQVPFSPWLFSAMAGPTPVSALLHSATMVAAGAYALIRLEPILSRVEWFGPLVMTIGLVTALAGGLVALAQSDLKKALAGSTSAQYGLILIATGAGFTGAGMGQLTAHALFKSLLFLGAGVALHSAGTLDLADLKLGRAVPRVAAMFGIGALALAAVPPVGAAFTKEAVLAASVDAGLWVAAGTLAAGLLSAIYAARLHLLAFGPGPGRPPESQPNRQEVVALGLLAALTLGLSALWLPGGSDLMGDLTSGRVAEGKAWELAASVGSVVLAFALATYLWRRDSLVDMRLPRRIRGFVAAWWGIPAATKRFVVDPLIGLSRSLSVGDHSVIDGVVRAVATSATSISVAVWRFVESLVDLVVNGVGAVTLGVADTSRVVDDDGVDAAVESVAAGIGFGGAQSRRLQTGMSHHYYTQIAIGTVVAVLVVAIWR